MRVKGFGVQCLETLCLSADLVFRVWKRCACQGIWCSMSRNAVPVSGFNVQKVEMFCLSADLAFRIWKRCACQRMWCSNLETLRFLTNLVLRGWERCACQRIWCSMSGNIVPVV